MSFDLSEMEYLSGVWFVGGQEGDWMAMVYRNTGETDWRLTYRFRYNEGKQVGDPFNDEDRKKWYELTAAPGEGAEKKLVDCTNFVAQMTALRYNTTVDFIDVRGEPALFVEKAGGRSWLHMSSEEEPVLTDTGKSPRAKG
jgi:hypothetical protein